MTPLWIAVLLCVFLLHPKCSLCQVQDDPVLTRISEPISHGEGPHWDPVDKVLYFVDIAGQTLHRYDPTSKTEKTISFDKPVTLVVPIKDQKHKFVVTLGLDMVILTWDWDSGFSSTSPIVSVDQQSRGNRWNDGNADNKGRMWAGTMGREEPVGVVTMNVANFYRIDNDPTVPCKADVEITPVSISNGIAWSLDNKILYYIDTPTRKIDAFDFDLDKGTISNRRTVFEFGGIEGNPDGMTIDSNGNLWIACWGGSQVIQVNPSAGQLMKVILLPVERITSVAFGGENLDTLYITTMRLGLNATQLEEQPFAGALWELTNLKVTGTLANTAVVNCKSNN